MLELSLLYIFSFSIKIKSSSQLCELLGLNIILMFILLINHNLNISNTTGRYCWRAHNF